MLTQIQQSHASRERIAHQLFGRVRNQNLCAVRRRRDTRRPIHRRPVIVTLPHLRVTGVKTHPHPQLCRQRPRLTQQLLLRVDRGCDRGGAVANAACAPSPVVFTT
jgi:hypothetical protein